MEKSTPPGRVLTGEEAHRLGRRQSPRHGHEGCEHPGAAATVAEGVFRRFLGEEAAVAARARAGVDRRDLHLVSLSGRHDERAARADAGGVDREAGRKVVARVEDEIHGPHRSSDGAGIQAEGESLHREARVAGGQTAGRGLRLASAEILLVVKRLTRKIGHIHRVEVVEHKGAHAGGGEVKGGRTADAAHPHDEHAGRAETGLTLLAETFEDVVTRVAKRGGVHGTGGW